MPDICIYYSKEDKQRVELLGNHLRSFGWDVWWFDYNNTGEWNSLVESKTRESRCVIPIWTSVSIDPEKTVVNETKFARDHKIPILQVRLNEVVLPIQFNLENTTDIIEWDGENNHKGLKELIGKLTKNVSLQNKWNGKRPSIIDLSGKQVKLPCFVKSLSSHETQLDPEGGLFTLNLFPEVDALLVSAYDMYLADDIGTTREECEQYKNRQDRHQYICETLNELDERGALILMDSGNYEKSRKEGNDWSGKKLSNKDSWTEERFNWVLDNVPYTYAFCFDNLEPSSDPVKNALDVISRIERKHEEFLIPILHAPLDANDVRDHELLPDIFFEYASRKKSCFIAIPERELGEGISKKVETIIKIREKLNTLGYYQPIHILGTGNPLSILILAAAGADLFDGLEWCRTVADRTTGFIFHHQQFEFFRNQYIKKSRFPLIKEILEGNDASLKLKMGLHNIQFFQDWMEDLQGCIKNDNVHQMIIERANFNSHEYLAEIKILMPGLFK